MTLQERLRALTAPCREVDAAIRNKFVGDFAYCDADTGYGCADYPNCSDGHGCGVECGMFDERTSYPRDWRDDERLPHYTASLDAAVELVEREMPSLLEPEWSLENTDYGYWACVGNEYSTVSGQAHTLPAVALLLALIEAKELEPIHPHTK